MNINNFKISETQKYSNRNEKYTRGVQNQT